MKKMLIFCTFCAFALACKPQAAHEPSLKSALGDKFLIGTSVNQWQQAQPNSTATQLIARQFNSVVAENCMKCAIIHPEENRFNFDLADQFVDFGTKNKMFIVGHCLIWHSQLAPWFCVDKDGKNVSADILKARMKSHIQTVVGQYKGRVKGWDVVNEAIEDNGSWRKSKFYQILGEDFIPLAFQYAHEADPDAELYYNDYNMFISRKRETVIKLIKTLKDKGLRIDAVGMQGHIGMDYPSLEEFEKSITAYAAAGVKVMVTEFDMSALPTVQTSANVSDKAAYKARLNPYPNGLPDSVQTAWNERMKSFFNLFLKHSDVITRVNLWGLSDGNSWKNGFPIPGRTDYPLLFDRDYQPKAVTKWLMTIDN